MRLKLAGNDKKDETITVRCTTAQLYDIKRKAMLYCGGNVSEYLVYTGKHYTPSKDELVDPLEFAGARPAKRGPYKKKAPTSKKSAQ